MMMSSGLLMESRLDSLQNSNWVIIQNKKETLGFVNIFGHQICHKPVTDMKMGI
jgi:hypothetical protein